MKVIFLDVDGVLNRDDWRNENYNSLGYMGLDDKLVRKYLDWFYSLSEKPMVVLSSDWRNYHATMDDLNRAGVHFQSTTEPFQGYRGRLIRSWLLRFPDVTHYVIFDDNDDEISIYHKENFVQTDAKKGLTDEDLIKASEILGY